MDEKLNVNWSTIEFDDLNDNTQSKTSLSSSSSQTSFDSSYLITIKHFLYYFMVGFNETYNNNIFKNLYKKENYEIKCSNNNEFIISDDVKYFYIKEINDFNPEEEYNNLKKNNYYLINDHIHFIINHLFFYKNEYIKNLSTINTEELEKNIKSNKIKKRGVDGVKNYKIYEYEITINENIYEKMLFSNVVKINEKHYLFISYRHENSNNFKNPLNINEFIKKCDFLNIKDYNLSFMISMNLLYKTLFIKETNFYKIDYNNKIKECGIFKVYFDILNELLNDDDDDKYEEEKEDMQNAIFLTCIKKKEFEKNIILNKNIECYEFIGIFGNLFQIDIDKNNKKKILYNINNSYLFKNISEIYNSFYFFIENELFKFLLKDYKDYFLKERFVDIGNCLDISNMNDDQLFYLFSKLKFFYNLYFSYFIYDLDILEFYFIKYNLIFGITKIVSYQDLELFSDEIDPYTRNINIKNRDLWDEFFNIGNGVDNNKYKLKENLKLRYINGNPDFIIGLKKIKEKRFTVIGFRNDVKLDLKYLENFYLFQFYMRNYLILVFDTEILSYIGTILFFIIRETDNFKCYYNERCSTILSKSKSEICMGVKNKEDKRCENCFNFILN